MYSSSVFLHQILPFSSNLHVFSGSRKTEREEDADGWVTKSVVIFWLANPLTAIISAR